ncbi:hypothetical protein GWI33_010859, partial [Rhynchophorus ferrugineus]
MFNDSYAHDVPVQSFYAHVPVLAAHVYVVAPVSSAAFLVDVDTVHAAVLVDGADNAPVPCVAAQA